MATFSSLVFSGSTNGRPIKVVATGTPGTLIHATGANIDRIWLYAVNTSLATVALTIEFGGTTNPDDLIIVGIPSQSGLVQVVAGSPLSGSLSIRAFAAVANAIKIIGEASRITP